MHKPSFTADQPAQLDSMNSRRHFLQQGGVGLGAIALNWLVQQDEAKAAAGQLAHHAARAKNVIWLFMAGGPSHLDLVDPKPLLNKLAGQSMPASFKEPITPMGEQGSPLLAAPRTWTRHGESGM